jgi:hypothetical protein
MSLTGSYFSPESAHRSLYGADELLDARFKLRPAGYADLEAEVA